MRWEYSVMDVNVAKDGSPGNEVDEQTILDACGHDGWELVSMLAVDVKWHRAYLKRRVD